MVSRSPSPGRRWIPGVNTCTFFYFTPTPCQNSRGVRLFCMQIRHENKTELRELHDVRGPPPPLTPPVRNTWLNETLSIKILQCPTHVTAAPPDLYRCIQVLFINVSSSQHMYSWLWLYHVGSSFCCYCYCLLVVGGIIVVFCNSLSGTCAHNE